MFYSEKVQAYFYTKNKIEVQEVRSLDPLQFPGRRRVRALLSPASRLLHFQTRKSF
jgi:hypothetical protein